jgi:lipoprotein
MKTLKKWMMMSALAASLFGFAGCALFGGLSSGSSSQQSTEKRGIIYSEQTFGSVKLSLEWNVNSARANPLGCYAQNQKTYRISLVAVDNLSEGTSFYFDGEGTAKSQYDEIIRFIRSSDMYDPDLYKNITLFFGGLNCYNSYSYPPHSNGAIIYTDWRNELVYCFKSNEEFVDSVIAIHEPSRIKGKNQFIGDYFGMPKNPFYDDDQQQYLDGIDPTLDSRTTIDNFVFTSVEQNRYLKFPQAAYSDRQKLYIIYFRWRKQHTYFYFDNEDRAIRAWLQLKQEYSDEYLGDSDKMRYVHFYTDWTLNYGGSYCTDIKYNYVQMFEYCFTGKGSKANPFEGGRIAGKKLDVRPYIQ